MSETMLMWAEIIFDVLYLVTVWTVVIIMWTKRNQLTNDNKRLGFLFLIIFFLLAFGDTGHVGFRVIAFAKGGLEENPTLVGIGALATAITVTFFYMLVVEIWRTRFHKDRNIIYYALIGIGVLRLILMIPSGNQWGSVVPPLSWSLIRNVPLMIQGVGVAILILLDSIKTNDRFSKKVSLWIFVSYACYLPVILFVQQVPLIGMLMIPKTLAYIAILFLALKLFNQTDTN